MKHIIARIIELREIMKYSNGNIMGYHSHITFSEEELNEMRGYIK